MSDFDNVINTNNLVNKILDKLKDRGFDKRKKQLDMIIDFDKRNLKGGLKQFVSNNEEKYTGVYNNVKFPKTDEIIKDHYNYDDLIKIDKYFGVDVLPFLPKDDVISYHLKNKDKYNQTLSDMIDNLYKIAESDNPEIALQVMSSCIENFFKKQLKDRNKDIKENESASFIS